MNQIISGTVTENGLLSPSPSAVTPMVSPQFADKPAVAHNQEEILLIEDCDSDAELVRHAFEHAGLVHPLRVIRNSEEGLDYLFGVGTHTNKPPGRPKLILLDLNLPGMSGIEFLRCVKEDALTRDIPVVVLSHTKYDNSIMTCIRLGASGYMVKPLTIDALIKATENLKLPLHFASIGG